MKDILSGLALVAFLAAPNVANAILDGSGRLRPTGKPHMFYEFCSYKKHRLDLICDETKLQPRCTVIKAYNLNGEEVPYQSLNPTPIIDLFYLESGNVCKDREADKKGDEFIGV